MCNTGSYVLGPHFYHSQSHKIVKGEDTWAIHPDACAAGTDFALYGVFDGHGSKEAAKFVAKNILGKLQEFLGKAVSNTSVEQRAEGSTAHLTDEQARICMSQDELISKLPGALSNTFLSLDEDFRENGQDSGTTATVVAVVGWEVFVANVGDSLAYLDTGSECIRVSANHRIDDSLSERNRIKSAGGSIARAAVNNVGVGPLRAWPGGLAMGRTIGDPSAGDFVHSQPEVHQFTLPITGGRIIVASDGLWDMVNPKTACHHIRGMGSTQGGKALVKLATQKTKSDRDDVTVLILDALTHKDGRVPIALSKTMNAPLSRTLSSMSSASANSQGAECHEGVELLKPLENKQEPWQDILWNRRAAMGQHLIWMQEIDASISRLSIDRTQSCPPEQSIEIQCIAYEGFDREESPSSIKQQDPVIDESGWQIQSKSRHRRSASEAHPGYLGHGKRAHGSSRGNSEIGQRMRKKQDYASRGSASAAGVSSVDPHKIVITSRGSTIEMSMDRSPTSKHSSYSGSPGSCTDSPSTQQKAHDQNFGGNKREGNQRPCTNNYNRELGGQRRRENWEHRGREAESSYARKKKNTHHHQSFSHFSSLHSGKNSRSSLSGRGKYMHHFRPKDDVVNA